MLMIFQNKYSLITLSSFLSYGFKNPDIADQKRITIITKYIPHQMKVFPIGIEVYCRTEDIAIGIIVYGTNFEIESIFYLISLTNFAGFPAQI